VWAAPQTQPPGLIHTLVSSYTPGEQLSLEVTPDGTRGFLALGATIDVLDLTGVMPVEIEKHPMPDCQPLAMRYYEQAGVRYLFIAGGALGVWRLTLCPGLFSLSNPTPCGPVGYADLLVQDKIEFGSFERKRCVDVEVLDTPSNGPLLLALWASSSDSAFPQQSATELRAYTWTAGTATQVASYVFPTASTIPPNPPASVGMALALDPADHDSVYLAMGKGGIWRADLSYGSGSWSIAVPQQVWASGTCNSSQSPEHVRDISIVRVQAQSVLYAALNYGEVLEITDLGGGSQACLTYTISPAGYPRRITAVTNGGTDVRVAIMTESDNGKWTDGAAPLDVNAYWYGPCLSTWGDPGAPDLGPTKTMVQFHQHDFSAAGGGTLALQFSWDLTDQLGTADWNSSILLPDSGGATDQLYLSSRLGGLMRFGLNLTSGAVWPIGLPFVGEAFGAQDNIASYVNPGVVLFQPEYAGAVASPPQMVYVDPIAPYGITTVPKTEHSPCENDYPLTPTCPVDPHNGTVRGPIEPQLYEGNLLDEAHWVDPTAPDHEYFLPGRKLWERYDSQSCASIIDCDPNYSSPCDSSGHPTWNLERPLWGPLSTDGTQTGWRLVRLKLPPAPTKPPDGPWMEAQTWLIQDPVMPVTKWIPDEQSSATDDRTQSVADMRMVGGYPTVLYVTRSASSHGVTALKTAQIVAKAQMCFSTNPLAVGTGETLATLDYQSTMTHLELEWRELPLTTVHSDCKPIVHCPGVFVAGSRQLYNDHTDLYMTHDLSGAPMWVLAIASGLVASGNDPSAPQGSPLHQSPDCAWGPYAGRPMLVLVDVTTTGDGVSFAPPQVLRIALGSGEGNAFAVRTKTVGSKTYAYVGDMTGKISVFDVSGKKLLPLPPHPYVAPVVQPLFLDPIIELGLPSDPYDGGPANCIDLEIVGNFMYCALGRLGVGIVDITQPTNPVLIDVMDTPGLVLGLSTRIVPNGTGTATQLIVGDSHCGPRIYQ
jgi:hypothetical protein